MYYSFSKKFNKRDMLCITQSKTIPTKREAVVTSMILLNLKRVAQKRYVVLSPVSTVMLYYAVRIALTACVWVGYDRCIGKAVQ
jgi:hypothetical protein